MRILIYILAMLTGFSAAEAVPAVSAMPAAVDAAAGQAYAAAAVKVAAQTQVRPVSNALFSGAPSADLPAGDAFSAMLATTPVLRHDVILG